MSALPDVAVSACVSFSQRHSQNNSAGDQQVGDYQRKSCVVANLEEFTAFKVQ